jgi:hypothetical protein
MICAAWLRLEAVGEFPPGLSRDEAVILPHLSATSGVFPLFETEEPEPLHRAMLLLVYPLTGGSIPNTRAAQAVIGVLTVALAYWAALQWLKDVDGLARHAGAFAAAGTLAVALGHVTLSRALYRGILQVPFMLAVLGFLARGLREGRWRDFVLSGLMAALAILSYTAAFVLPIAFAVLGAASLVLQPRQWRRWLPQLAIVALTAGLVLLPLLWRALTVPESIFGRASAVAAESHDWGRLVRGMLDQLLVAGDENPQYNVAEAPVIPPLAQPLFLLGCAALLLRIRRPETWFLLALSVVVSLPAMLSDELTHGLRVVGWFAVFPIVSALGVGWALHRLAARPAVGRWAAIGFGLVFGALLVQQTAAARAVYRDYWLNADDYRLWRVFGTELNHSEWFFRTDIEALFAWIAAQDRPTMLPFDYVDEAHARAWAFQHFPQAAAWPLEQPLPPGTQVIFPTLPSNRPFDRQTQHYVMLYDDALYVLPLMRPLELDEAFAEVPGFGRFGALGQVYALPTDAAFAPIQPTPSLRFGDDLELVGWAGPRDLTSGRWQGVLYWRALRRIGHDYQGFVQILTQEYERIGGADVLMGGWALPTTLWEPRKVYPQPAAFDLPPLEWGAYRLAVGVYPPFGRPIAAYDQAGQALPAPVTADWVRVPLRTSFTPDGIPIDVVFNERAALRAYRVRSQPDGSWLVELEWQALQDLDGLDATIFVHLLDAEGSIIAQQDTRPLGGHYPTLVWREGDVVVTQHVLSAPDAVMLRVGLYTLPEVRNLPVTVQGRAQEEPFILLPLQ